MITPPVAAVGAKILAADINKLSAMNTVWVTYAVTITNFSSASTAPTITGRYAIAGNTCHVTVTGKLGTGTITVAGMTVSLPVTMDTTGMISQSTLLNGSAGFQDVSVPAAYVGGIRMLDANTVTLLRPSTSGTGVSGTTQSTLPFTWATLDEVSASFSYPIA